jgi:hypothetical protein
VSLTTDDPLVFHVSDNPLKEEYSIARNYVRPEPCGRLGHVVDHDDGDDVMMVWRV